VLVSLGRGNHELALEIARIPDAIKGFGHVKERNLAAARQRWASLMRDWQAQAGQQRAA
jgi:indolepyruvate ferredoxin oxidoreductase